MAGGAPTTGAEEEDDDDSVGGRKADEDGAPVSGLACAATSVLSIVGELSA